MRQVKSYHLVPQSYGIISRNDSPDINTHRCGNSPILLTKWLPRYCFLQEDLFLFLFFYLVITQYKPRDYIQLILGQDHQKDLGHDGYTGTPIL